MVYVPQDIVDLIIDQLCSATLYCGSSLRATSLVSTAWVNPSQRHLFFTLCLYSSSDVRKWCSRIRPGPHGISRHVRVLKLSSRLVISGIPETTLPHFTSFQNCHRAIFHAHFPTVFSTLSPTHSFISFTLPLLSLFSALLSRYELAIRFTTLTNYYDLMTIPFILFLIFIHTLSFDEMRT